MNCLFFLLSQKLKIFISWMVAVGNAITVWLIDTTVELLGLLLVVVALDGEARVALEVIPQRAHQLAHHDVVRVLFHDA